MYNKKTPLDVQAAIICHYNELMAKARTKKHPLYNQTLRFLRIAEIPYQTINCQSIICQGMLKNMWLRFTDDGYCNVITSGSKFMLSLKIDSSLQVLIEKLYKKEIISNGVYDHLQLSYIQLFTKRYEVRTDKPRKADRANKKIAVAQTAI